MHRRGCSPRTILAVLAAALLAAVIPGVSLALVPPYGVLVCQDANPDGSCNPSGPNYSNGNGQQFVVAQYVSPDAWAFGYPQDADGSCDAGNLASSAYYPVLSSQVCFWILDANQTSAYVHNSAIVFGTSGTPVSALPGLSFADGGRIAAVCMLLLSAAWAVRVVIRMVRAG